MTLLASSGLPPLLQDIGVAILVAAALAFLARRLGQPLLLAYVLAGILLGPSALGFHVVKEQTSIDAISNLGLILLLYLIGLEIDVKALRRSGRAVLLAGLLQLPINAVLCLVVPIVLNWTGALGDLGPYGVLYLVFGLSLSSTLVVVKLLYDKMELDTLPGRLTLGVLVVQDLWAVLFLAVQPTLTKPEIGTLLLSLGTGAGVIAAAFVVARYLLPPLFRGAARVPELVVLGALGWCFLVAGLSSKAGLSAEMGALAAGLSLGTLPYREDIAAKVGTVRDFFLTLFFVSLGLRASTPTLPLGLTAVLVGAFVLLARFVALTPTLRRLKAGDRAALIVPMNLWPVSEFALVLTSIGIGLGHVTGAVLDVVLFSMILTCVSGTYLVLASHKAYQRVSGWLQRLGWISDPGAADAPNEAEKGHAVVMLGFHRTASAFLHDLRTRRPELVADLRVLDFNPVVLQDLARRGISCAYADLANPDTLQHAGIEHAKVVVSAIPDTLLKGTTNLRLLRHVRRRAPHALFVATAETAAVEQALYAEGAAAVLVPQRPAGHALLDDVATLLAGGSAPSAAAGRVERDEVLP